MARFQFISEVNTYLFQALPMFQRDGAVAFNKNLDRTLALMDYLNHPQNSFKSIHVGGTNGKGTTCHMLASVFQTAGYKTGLYTSPHLKRYNERIRLDGIEIPDQYVIDFVNRHYEFIEEIKPSFFEISVGLAFDYFRSIKIDIAIIEVGMGGRLDSTNVITPILSIITNIGYDHMQFLGNTLAEIAFEKAGIIKSNTPVVIGELSEETKPVFEKAAADQNAQLHLTNILVEKHNDAWKVNGPNQHFQLEMDLKGDYIGLNLPAVLTAFDLAINQFPNITPDHILRGLENTAINTGLRGRWQVLAEKPYVVCDTGHNLDGVRNLIHQMNGLKKDQKWLIWGSVNDKELDPILELLPKDANYVFSTPNVPRGLPAAILAEKALQIGIQSQTIEDVNKAVDWVLERASSNDLVFIGGSTFLVADLKEL